MHTALSLSVLTDRIRRTGRSTALEPSRAPCGTKLIVATAYFPENNPHSADVLKDDAYKVTGKAPVYDILRTARERATAAGAGSVEERSIEGAPVDALLDLVVNSKADLLVVGNVGLNTIAGRLLGSVPSDVARRSKCDVLIVHTT